jgi:hypothetical protein
MKILLVIISLLICLFLFGKIYFILQFSNQVKAVFTESEPDTHARFELSQLDGLPIPVKQYFLHVLKVGQPIIRTVRLKHNGLFKSGLDKDWGNIEGEQYFSTDNPAYIWKGSTNTFTARDFYIAGKGGLMVTLLSLFKVVDVKGPAFNKGELLRWLMESIWFPTNLLPGENMHWTAIDSTKARLDFKHNGLSLFIIYTFNAAHEIVEMETVRNMDAARIETWIGNPLVYKEMNGVKIPTEVEVLWRLKDGDFPYARFKVLELDYDIPLQF